MQRDRYGRAIPPGRAVAIRRGLGDYGQGDPNSNPPGFYNERAVFGGPEGFDLTNGPKRSMIQFSFAAGPVAVQILPANYRRSYLIIQNKSTTASMFFGFTSAIDANSGIGLAPGSAGPPQTPGGNYLGDYSVPTDEIWVFCATAAQLGVCAEGSIDA